MCGSTDRIETVKTENASARGWVRFQMADFGQGAAWKVNLTEKDMSRSDMTLTLITAPGKVKGMGQSQRPVRGTVIVTLDEREEI